MKKSIIMYICFLILGICVSCEDENLSEKIPMQQQPRVGSPEYYANLRAYKKTKHQLAFGWFGNSGGEGKSSNINERWESIPDSTDIVSCWGGLPPKGSSQYEAMQIARKVKGTKVVLVTFSDDNMLKWAGGEDFFEVYGNGDKELLYKGFEKVAKTLVDMIEEYDIDGLDIDHEPFVGGGSWEIARDADHVAEFIRILSKNLGPKSGTDRLLIVDGEYDQLKPEIGDCLDYLITQAYSTPSGSNLQYRYDKVSSWWPPHKFIVTETFEANGQGATGGVPFSDPVRGTIPSILGMAYWQPLQGIKGGAGAYHAEYDIGYRYFRQMIQIMNPAVK